MSRYAMSLVGRSADLTMAVIAINGWNRLSVAFRTPVGNCVPAAVG